MYIYIYRERERDRDIRTYRCNDITTLVCYVQCSAIFAQSLVVK